MLAIGWTVSSEGQHLEDRLIPPDLTELTQSAPSAREPRTSEETVHHRNMRLVNTVKIPNSEFYTVCRRSFTSQVKHAFRWTGVSVEARLTHCTMLPASACKPIAFYSLPIPGNLL